MIKYESKKSCLKLKRTDSTTITSIKLPNSKEQIISIPSPIKIYNINKDTLNQSKL